MSAIRIPHQRAVIDRRGLAAAIATVVADKGAQHGRKMIVHLLREALEKGRAELSRRLAERPGAGYESAHGHAFLTDQLIRVIYDHVISDLYPSANPSKGERIALMAVGGYGRGEMAPQSDVDIAFITPDKPTAWCEQVIEAVLYYLWDLGLKVGQSSRSLAEMLRMAREDLTIRTAILEGRYLWADQPLYEEATARFWGEVVPGSESEFVRQKLAERDARHQRMGGSRYVVEPNVKDGKGGLRDLQTLYWIGKYLHRGRSAAELVERGLFTREEYRSFRRAEGFLLAVRAHLHSITGRAEDRLTFDLQREVARRMHYADRPGKSAVERFMQFYFLQARHVGHLSGVFLAHIEEEQEQRRGGGLLAAGLRRMGLGRERPAGNGAEAGLAPIGQEGESIAKRLLGRKIGGYPLVSGKLAAPSDDWFRDDPVRLIEIFRIAEREGVEIHPTTMRMLRRDRALIKGRVRKDPRANALFLDVLTGRKDPENALRWMNEAGVFGRFIPDFGKVGGQMQFDMYHHYTVDEHTIRAIGLLSRIERGELVEDHPLATEIIARLGFRRVLYVATLLHDIAKGRGGDHSVLGAQVAEKLCPRLGFDAEETALTAWLVRYHLLMSATAFKRDLADPKTIDDFAAEVGNIERLRQLLVLTMVDIRAVGPGIWNGWKRQLLEELYRLTEERLQPGERATGKAERIGRKMAEVAELLGEQAHLIDDLDDRLDDDYWLSEPADIIAMNLPHYAAAKRLKHSLSIHCQYYPALGATLVTFVGDDRPGLFYRLAGAIHLAGGNVIDARIHTTRVGKAIDNFLVQDPLGRPFSEEMQLERLEQAMRDALAGTIELAPQLAKRPLPRTRAEHFRVEPTVFFDNEASRRFTVIEVTATDRPALLYRLARAMFEERLALHSAHITHYGERVVDTFYVTDPAGGKIALPERLAKIEQALLEAIATGETPAEAAH